MPRRADGSFLLAELADLREGYVISAHCLGNKDGRRCGEWAWLDSDTLIRQFGGHFPLVRLEDRLCGALTCVACGGRELALRVSSVQVRRRPATSGYQGLSAQSRVVSPAD